MQALGLRVYGFGAGMFPLMPTILNRDYTGGTIIPIKDSLYTGGTSQVFGVYTLRAPSPGSPVT